MNSEVILNDVFIVMAMLEDEMRVITHYHRPRVLAYYVTMGVCISLLLSGLKWLDVDVTYMVPAMALMS